MMTDYTKAKIKELVQKFGEFGVNTAFIYDCMSEAGSLSELRALEIIEACAVNEFTPDQLTEQQRELLKHLLKHRIARTKIVLTNGGK